MMQHAWKSKCQGWDHSATKAQATLAVSAQFSVKVKPIDTTVDSCWFRSRSLKYRSCPSMETSRHIPTFHGGQSCPSPVAEAHPVNEKTPKADAAVVVRGIGIIPVRIPINQVAAQKDRSRFSTMRHPWFLNIFEPCQRWQLTEFRCLYSASWCVWALQLSATNATRTKRYQKVNFQGRNQI